MYFFKIKLNEYIEIVYLAKDCAGELAWVPCGIESWESEVAGTPGKAADWSQEARLPTPAPSLSYSVSPRKHPLVSRGTIHTYLTESFRRMSEIIHENILRN